MISLTPKLYLMSPLLVSTYYVHLLHSMLDAELYLFTLAFSSAYTLHNRKCPHVGRYTVTGQMSQQRRKRKAIESNIATSDSDTTHLDNFADCTENSFHSLVVGCQNNNDNMEFQSACSNIATSYSCHGTWEENGTSYLIASTSKSTGAKRICFIYTREMLPIAEGYNRLDGKHGPMAAARRSSVLRLSTVAESCLRDVIPGHNGAWAFNLTVEGLYKIKAYLLHFNLIFS